MRNFNKKYSSWGIGRKINEARTGGWTHLFIWDKGVTSSDLSILAEEPGVGKLKDLSISSNKLTSLPAEIGQLKALKSLSLRGDQLASLPPEIGQLKALESLSLSGKQLATLPAEIGQLTALKSLELDFSRFKSIPPQIGQLKALTSLDLSYNLLTSLPPELGQLKELKELYLHGNGSLGIPPEVLGPDRSKVRQSKAKPPSASEILSYYFKTRVSGGRALNEVKVIFVGQGAVGKTSLVKRIVEDKFDAKEKRTEGINVDKRWHVPAKTKGEKVQVNFWDVGGQEIMHATHQFFLTKRSIYVLVLDARKGENEGNIHYWLKIIGSYAVDSPIHVVTNKCDEHQMGLDETRLQKDYPNIHGFHQTSCQTGMGIAGLKESLATEILATPHVFDALPKEYFDIKQQLEKMAAKENHISTRRYYALAQDLKVSDPREQDRLLRLLHDLGSVLCFNDPDSPFALRERSVLDPQWVTQGVYQILNGRNACGCNGVLTRRDLEVILKLPAYPVETHEFIVEMMQKFELCFEFERGKKWLIPELLPEKEPPSLDAGTDALRFQYHYTVLPVGIICRFIVRRFGNFAQPPLYWRSGVVLEFDGCKAIVRSDKDKGRMFIAVTGPDKSRRGFLAIIRNELDSIHATIPGLQPTAMVPLPDNPKVCVEYEHLVTQERAEIREFIPQGAKRLYSVMSLLDGIEDELIRGWLNFGYRMLQPPFFVVEPETSFADAWEVFCCDVLNRHHKTTDMAVEWVKEDSERFEPVGRADGAWVENIQIAEKPNSQANNEKR